MATQRIYIVKNNTTGTVRLIKSTVVSQAIAHAAKQEFTAHVASQDELVDSLNSGVKVEKVILTASEQGELL
jgi:UDP-N-acetylmuramyl pentapeptide synthase